MFIQKEQKEVIAMKKADAFRIGELFAVISALSHARLAVHSEVQEDGTYISWLEMRPGLWGQGSTIADSLDDMYETLCGAERDYWEEMSSIEDLALMLKVRYSTPEEFMACLDGKS